MNNMKIYARKTKIVDITTADADAFIHQYHDQGLPVIGKGRFDAALSYNNEIVGVITCSNPRTSAKKRVYQQELVRLTFKKDIRVIGGASKLIKHYVRTVQPRNFFTYQTLGGELTSVYEHAGMTFVKKTKTKQILVKNGYDYASALSNRDTKYLYLNSQLVNLGPDHLLGTSIGEQYENGKRLTNAELFTKYCDYHTETVPGDAVYEYNNPNYLHYIYRITNDDAMDNHYYIGRHSIYTPNHSIEDIFNDTYMGSGGRKYKQWVKKTQEDGHHLQKEILSIQENYSQNLFEEEKIIGTLYETDDQCLNSVRGGTQSYINSGIRPQHIDQCKIHGETLFNGPKCMLCYPISDYHMRECERHGLTIHNHTACCACTTEKGLSKKVCEKHGLVKHRGEMCLACQVNQSPIYEASCHKHGLTKHKGNTCLKCSSKREIKTCPRHGQVSFNGNHCTKCVNQRTVTKKRCEIHGLTKFQGDKCCRCIQSVTIQWCDECGGETKWRYGKCLKTPAPSKRFTPKKETSRAYCSLCQKETRHVNDKCMSCVEKSLYNQQNCPKHGLTKFRAKTCCACRAEKMRAQRKQRKENKI